MKKQEFYNHKKPRKLLDQVRDVMRLKHYAFRAECTYISWIKRFILFHDKKHPKEMGESAAPSNCYEQGGNTDIAERYERHDTAYGKAALWKRSQADGMYP
ncbi:MAG: phage integrase N-terminal SAM-like domain-containing protein, partial [Thermodesulfobacteriota bacterium]|nr:phage integrase N-terminal SAM-like domain-containing protein [Thermodesulfobacteriota bacterium]